MELIDTPPAVFITCPRTGWGLSETIEAACDSSLDALKELPAVYLKVCRPKAQASHAFEVASRWDNYPQVIPVPDSEWAGIEAVQPARRYGHMLLETFEMASRGYLPGSTGGLLVFDDDLDFQVGWLQELRHQAWLATRHLRLPFMSSLWVPYHLCEAYDMPHYDYHLFYGNIAMYYSPEAVPALLPGIRHHVLEDFNEPMDLALSRIAKQAGVRLLGFRNSIVQHMGVNSVVGGEGIRQSTTFKKHR